MKWGLWALILGVIFLALTVFVVLKSLPNVEDLATYTPNETTKIFSADGAVLADLHLEENRVTVPLKDVSDWAKEALLATEDSNFYQHFGLDFKAILRAMTIDILRGGAAQGASTLTQQLARNVFLSKQKKLVRKIAEAILAVQLERHYTKDEILEMYLNQIYWGHNCYGIEAASLMYFGKSATKLNLPESAMLVGVIRAPEYYSPYRNWDRAKGRQKVVLRRMVAEKMISKEQAKMAELWPVKLNPKKTQRYKAPYFTSWIVERLVHEYGQSKVYHEGLKVYTTLDYPSQQVAEAVVKKYVQIGRTRPEKTSKGSSFNFEEAALISLDPRTGYIKAMVGGHDFVENGYNHCIQAQRPPGSSFKPFVYLTALQQGMSPGTILEDAPVNYNTVAGMYSPTNYDKKFRGPLTLQNALKDSVNLIAVRVINLIGSESVVKTAQALGIKSPLQAVLSLALGSNEVNMLEMASAYGVIANQGVRVEPVAILKITDRDGNVLFKHTYHEEKVFDENLLAILIQMMKQVVIAGTGAAAQLPDRPVAGKTGTTDAHKDAWFIGFIPQMVTAVWVGNDNNVSMDKVTGGLYPARMWREFMVNAVKEIPPENFPAPKNLVSIRICKTTGWLPGKTCPATHLITALFQRGDEPPAPCWFDHSVSRHHPNNRRPIIPSGWQGRNEYPEVDLKGNELPVPETPEGSEGAEDPNKAPEWLQE
jgi:penicillin-binding protein 1A